MVKTQVGRVSLQMTRSLQEVSVFGLQPSGRLALMALPAPAYYHFVTYLNGVAIREKFDLTALPNRHGHSVFVSEKRPADLFPERQLSTPY